MHLKKDTKGSLTLEASLIMPIFIVFLLLLMTMIRIAITEIALNNGVAETTKQIATHYYAIDLLYKEWNKTKASELVNKTIDDIDQERNEIIHAEDILKQYSEILPEGVNTLLYARESFENTARESFQELINQAFTPVVNRYLNNNIIDTRYLSVTKVTLPDLESRVDPYFGIELRYDMPLQLPFIHKTLVFKKKAYERVWIGATEDSNVVEQSSTELISPIYSGNLGNDTVDGLSIISMDYIIQQTNKKQIQTIYVKGPPRSSVFVTIKYPSGYVKSDSFMLSSAGYGTCHITIGFNTNPGIFKVIFTSGDLKTSSTFRMIAKAKMDMLNNE